MEEVLDGLRRIIKRWVQTTTPLTQDLIAGSTDVIVRTTSRFQVNDEIIIRTGTQYEKPEGLRITAIVDDNTIRLNMPFSNDWTVANSSVITKAFGGKLVQGIYTGDPENIPKFPAITINGISEDAEWMTLDSVKDAFNVEIGIFFEDATQEEGYRGLLRLTKLVKRGLSQHIFPLVNDYEMTALAADANGGDHFIRVVDPSIFCNGSVILIEDPYKTIEDRVKHIDVANSTIELYAGLPQGFLMADDAAVIRPQRFIFNSYPKSVQYGKIHKGTLLKAAVINWFGWEEVVNPTGGGGWTTPNIK